MFFFFCASDLIICVTVSLYKITSTIRPHYCPVSLSLSLSLSPSFHESNRSRVLQVPGFLEIHLFQHWSREFRFIELFVSFGAVETTVRLSVNPDSIPLPWWGTWGFYLQFFVCVRADDSRLYGELFEWLCSFGRQSIDTDSEVFKGDLECQRERKWERIRSFSWVRLELWVCRWFLRFLLWFATKLSSALSVSLSVSFLRANQNFVSSLTRVSFLSQI